MRLTQEAHGTLGFKFGSKLSPEDIDAKVAEYKADGWRHVDSVGRLCFASEDGRWWHIWDCQTGRGIFMDAEWLGRVYMTKNSKNEDADEG